MEPVIIEAAINGAVRKADNPHVPVTASEIAADAMACLDAGAAIVHAHCHPLFGSPEEVAERYLAAFRPVWVVQPGALLYPTLNVDGELSFEHLAIMAQDGLRIGLLDPGSRNAGGLSRDGVPSGTLIHAISFDKISEGLAFHAKHRLGLSLAIYEPGWLRTTLLWWRNGKLPPGAMIKFYLSEGRRLSGTPFGLPATPIALAAYLEIMDDCPVPWAVSVVGGDLGRSDVARIALERGGHLHVGLEFYGGDRKPKNAELVEEAVELCRQVGRPVATFHEAARILGLPDKQSALAD